ncbi:24448_t:CDS:2 [Dentiscutata erythropus]|uniref:24448_t:CDS:1 n=1 Tax=Dentiscutata erythropus TaxID=1348616 RepID=A0A9N9GMM8_9GLOM|nr:24448_t:CDS:2 [Dentiscutata erythropus]
MSWFSTKGIVNKRKCQRMELSMNGNRQQMKSSTNGIVNKWELSTKVIVKRKRKVMA